jgi:hypothetical protein
MVSRLVVGKKLECDVSEEVKEAARCVVLSLIPKVRARPRPASRPDHSGCTPRVEGRRVVGHRPRRDVPKAADARIGRLTLGAAGNGRRGGLWEFPEPGSSRAEALPVCVHEEHLFGALQCPFANALVPGASDELVGRAPTALKLDAEELDGSL